MRFFLITSLFSVALILPAYAYLDPGTGTMIVQAVVGAFAVAGAALSIYWRRFKSLFSRHKDKKVK